MERLALDKTTKSVFAKWCALINKRERYYMAKAMDLFYELPSEVQYQMLRFFMEEMNLKKHEDKLEDSTQFPDLIRAVLYHYSGREDAGQPSKIEFGRKLAEFLRSSHMREAKIGEGSIDFVKELKEMETTHATE